MSKLSKKEDRAKRKAAYAKRKADDKAKLINPKASDLGEAIKKHLGADKMKQLELQPSTIANGGLVAIVKRVSETISPKTPSLKAVAVVQVLAQCGSHSAEADLAIK
jgi:hypothetical protein